MMASNFPARECRPASTAWILTKTALQMVVFWSFFLAVLPYTWLAIESFLGVAWLRFPTATTKWFGWALFGAGGGLGITTAVLMARYGRGTPLPADCATQLVVQGPYRHVRNPMAIAGLSQGVAVGLLLGSGMVILYAVLGGPVWHVLVRPWEEADLQRRFGKPYQEYRAAVRCWWPRWTPYSKN